VDLELARELISDQFPEINVVELHHIGTGWDNDVYQVGELMFRFPRRPIGVELIQTERDALGMVAPIVELPIPTPLKIGQPTERFPYPFLGQHYVVGCAPEDLSPQTIDRAALAPILGRFLRRLHGVPISEAEAWGVPTDPFLGEMQRMAAQIAGGVEEMASEPLLPRVLEALQMFPPDGDPEEATLCHGDLHVRHLLFDPQGMLSGVIDWGDLCIGDPAMDLIVVYAMLEPAHRQLFWEEYGPASAKLRARARHLALAKHLALLSSAVEMGQAEVARVARDALELAPRS